MANLNFTLKIIHILTNEQKIFNSDEFSYFDSKSTGVQYKIRDGSQATGILTGSGFPVSGKKINLTLPIFTDINNGLLNKIAEWNRYLLNPINHRFFIITNFEGKDYELEVVPENGINISTDFILMTKKQVVLSFALLDNFYQNNDLIESELVTQDFIGVRTYSYTSETFIVTPTTFKSEVFGSGGLDFRVSLRGGFGIHTNIFLQNEQLHTIIYDGISVIVNNVSIPYDGKLLQIEFGLNTIRIASTFECRSCEIQYFPKVSL